MKTEFLNKILATLMIFFTIMVLTGLKSSEKKQEQSITIGIVCSSVDFAPAAIRSYSSQGYIFLTAENDAVSGKMLLVFEKQ